MIIPNVLALKGRQKKSTKNRMRRPRVGGSSRGVLRKASRQAFFYFAHVFYRLVTTIPFIVACFVVIICHSMNFA